MGNSPKVESSVTRPVRAKQLAWGGLLVSFMRAGRVSRRSLRSPAGEARRKRSAPFESSSATVCHGPTSECVDSGCEFLMGKRPSAASPIRPTIACAAGVSGWIAPMSPRSRFAEFVQATGCLNATAERSPTGRRCACIFRTARPRPGGLAAVPAPWCSSARKRGCRFDNTRNGALRARRQLAASAGPCRHRGRPAPVVQCRNEDAHAYRAMGGNGCPPRRMEFAARGGLEQATYAWGRGFSARRHLAIPGTRAMRPFRCLVRGGGAAATSRVQTLVPPTLRPYGCRHACHGAYWYRLSITSRSSPARVWSTNPRPADSSTP